MKQGRDRYVDGDMGGAIRAWESSLGLYTALDLKPSMSANLYNLGLAQRKQGDLSGALDSFRRGLDLAEAQKDLAEGQKTLALRRNGLRLLAVARYDMGDFAEAEPLLRQALSLDEALEDDPGVMTELTRMAGVSWQLGRYQEALTTYQRLLDLAGRSGDSVREANALGGIGLVNEELGRYEMAREHYERALEVFRKLGMPGAEGVTLNNLGFLKSTLGENQEALADYQRALELFRQEGDLRRESLVTSNMGEVYAGFGKNAEALEHLYRALDLHERIKDKRGQSLDRKRLGMVYEDMNSFLLAETNYKEGRELAEKVGRPETVWRTGYRLGMLHEKMGRDEEALEDYRGAVDTIESMVYLLQDREDREGFLGGKVEVYDALIKLLFRLHQKNRDQGYLSEANTVIERMRNLKSWARFVGVQESIEDLRVQNYFDKQRRMRARIRRIEERLAGDDGTLTRKQARALTRELEDERKALKAEFRKFVDELKEDPSFFMWVSVDPIKLNTIQAVLTPDEAILEYYITDRYTYIFVVSAEGLYVEYVNLDARVLDENIGHLRSFVEKKSSMGPEQSRYMKKIARELHDVLIGPVEGLIKGKKVLGILPNRKLHYLPFQMLVRTVSDGEDRYLLQDYSIFYLNTKGLLNLTRGGGRKRARPPLTFVGFANADGTLPLTETEVIEAGRGFAESRVFLRNDATEGQVKDLSGSYRLLHLATHGKLDPLEPRNSYLRLHPWKGEDGRLTVSEIYGLDLAGTDLVTLSACETAMGKLALGDEIVALSDAFLYAGTPSVLATLWCVDDRSTALLMKRYYTYLKDGRDKLDALREAQMDVLSFRGWDEKEDLPIDYSHPHYWASFILIGEYR